MDPIRDDMTRQRLRSYVFPVRPSLLLWLEGYFEQPATAAQMLRIGNRYRVELLGFVERGQTWN